MHYEKYTPEDFLKDDDFIQWVRNPTDAQSLFWENWLTTHPEKAQTVAKARDIILAVRYKNAYAPSESDMLTVWENIQRGLPSNTSGQHWSPKLTWPSIVRYAAAVVIVSISSWLVWNYSQRKEIDSKVVAGVVSNLVEHKTGRGRKETVTLPDGSMVTLNSESRISYQSNFGQGKRDVQLEGEAFFEVTPDPAQPFNIVTGDVVTTVVGTSFNINAYPDKRQIRVAVLTGKVKVADASGSEKDKVVTLVPNEMSVFEKETGRLVSSGFDAEQEFGWKNNTIVLKNADFQEIKKTLEREYAVTFVVDKGLKVKEEFSAKFENAPIKKVLDALNYTSRFQYNLVKDKVYVTKKDEK